GASYFAVRTQGTPTGVAESVRRALAEINPDILVRESGTMRSLMSAPLARPRLLAAVLSLYAIIVVVLAVAGLYAVVSASVTQRRREFGVRAALGATPRKLASLVLAEGLSVAAAGAIVGLATALAGSSILAAVLVNVSPRDPQSLALSTVALLGVCVVAVLLPARRAARADPARELRAE
ncbi:MAG: FtsX-like permease family protein, partial [Gemmatimonadaceae bacterium]